MTKKFLSMLLAIAMVVSMFAGLATTASAASVNDVFTKVTSLNELTSGEYLIVGATTTGNYTATVGAMATGTAGYMPICTPTIAGNDITFDGTAVTESAIWKITRTEADGVVSFTIQDSASLYLNNSGEAKNKAYVGKTAEALTIESGDATVAGSFTVSRASGTYKYLNWNYNNGSPRFAFYNAKNNSATMCAYLSFYKLNTSGNACTHANATSTVTTAATCTTAGEASWTCPDCPATWTTVIPATGHTWGEAVQTTAPTCTEDGLNTYTCSVCSGTKTEVIAATGHTYVGGTCSVCGAAEPVYYDYAKTELSAITAEHKVIITMTDGTTVWALSSANGSASSPAAIVVTPSGDKINTNDATLVWTITNANGVLTIAPDGATGATLYCNNSNSGVRVGTPSSTTAGNAFSIDETSGYLKVMTGTSARYLGVYKTTPDWRCYTNTTGNTAGQTLAFYAYKPAATEPTECTHTNVTEVPAASATCTAAGNSAYWSCPDCGKYFSDAACTTETTLEAVTIPATGHTPGAYTSNNDGTHTYTCSVCNEVVTESCSASVVEEVAATCKAYSQTEYECTVCGGSWIVTGTEYGAHNWVNNACSVCSLTRNSYVKVADVTTLKDGDGIVIYYPTGAMLLSGTASGSKLAGVAGTVTDTTVAANNADELFLIVRVDANGDYYFETNDGKYLTSGETGNSLTLADSLTDYAKWYFDTTGTTATLRIVSRNAFYNGTTAQALEYYNGFTTYSLKDKAAYNFEVYQLEGFSAHTHTWDQGTVTTEPTCTADGVKTFTCATCGDTMTEAIPALGHDYSAGDTCANCGLACIKGQLTAALADGDTVIVYNPASNMTLTNTPNGYNLDGLAAVDCGSYVLRATPETVVWTVEVVDAAAGTYRFKTADGVYFQSNSFGSFTNSATLPAAGEVDYSVWQLIDGKYLKNTGVSKALEYYGGKWQTYSSTRFGTAFELKFFKTNVESFCEHAYVETVISAPSCTTDGVSTFTCSLCGDTYTDTVVAPGHSYQVTAEVPATCTEAGSKTYTCSVCGDTYTEVVAATGHSDMNLDNLCDVCGVEVVNDAWALSTTAPAAGNKYVIVAHDTTANKWYALTTADVNAATSAGKEVLVSNNVLYNPDEDVIFGGRDSSYTSNAVVHTGVGFYESNAGKCLHLNNSKIRVTTGSQNGVFTFTAGTTENTFTMLSTVNTRYLTFANGSFGVSDVSGTELYFFYKACDHDKTYISGAAEPTCTVAGSTGATKCSWCGAEVVAAAEIPATGHTLVPVEAVAATCTTDGNDAYYKCSVCSALFADAEGTTALNAIPTVPATGHTEVTDAAVAPTCTATGLTAGSHCSVCGEVIVAQTEVAALGHSYTYTDNGDGTHTATCASGDDTYTEGHTFTDGTCDLCGATEVVTPIEDSSLTFVTTAFTMGAELKFVFIMTSATATKYPTTYVDIVVNGADGETTVRYNLEDMVQYGAVYRVEFAGIAAKNMGDSFTATIHAEDANGKQYVGVPKTASIAEQIKATLRKSTSSAAAKTLAVDMLNYGAAAQAFFNYDTEHLVNADLTEEELAYGTQEVPEVTNSMSKTTTGAITIVTPSVTLLSKVTLNMLFNTANYSGDVSKLTYKVIDVATGDVVFTGTPVQQSGTIYKCVYDDVGAKRMRSDVTIGIYDENDELVSQVQTWSVESYIADILGRSTTSDTTRALLENMIKYGDSAAAFLG